jgi:ABC-type uncharacterized transport system ATPase subunit
MPSRPGDDVVGALTSSAPTTGASADPLLEIREVTKQFGPVVACDRISVEVRPGEILGLLGQNGAGKSTLMKVVVGVEKPEQGEVRIAGQPVPPGDPMAAARAGVGMVHQHFSLVGRLTVWQNVVLGERDRFDRADAIARVRAIGERFGLEVDPEARVEDLSAGLRQRVEIIKCLRRDPHVIILDEPTSVLTQAESRRLFRVLQGLVREQGYAAVLISHRLDEILAATDRVTVLRDGRVVATLPTAEANPPGLANLMLGREVSLEREHAAVGLIDADDAFEQTLAHRTEAAATEPVLRVESVTVQGEQGRPRLDAISLHVNPGEIVGVAGVEGNGQDTLVDVLSDLVEPTSGRVLLYDPEHETGAAPCLRELGVIPADRHDSGCVLDMSVAENLVLNNLGSVSRRGVIDRSELAAHAARLIEQFDIKASDVHAPMWTLSGGNQQKLVLARELSRRPRVIVAAQPTRGLDVGAMEYMWHRLRQAAAEGAGVLLVSTELDEILALSDRVLVIYNGRIIGEMARGELDLERLGLLMGGQAA